MFGLPALTNGIQLIITRLRYTIFGGSPFMRDYDLMVLRGRAATKEEMKMVYHRGWKVRPEQIVVVVREDLGEDLDELVRKVTRVAYKMYTEDCNTDMSMCMENERGRRFPAKKCKDRKELLRYLRSAQYKDVTAIVVRSDREWEGEAGFALGPAIGEGDIRYITGHLHYVE